MLQLINPERYGEFIDDLAEMHRLRYRIFKERLGWDVQVSADMEVDEFDACRPVYLLQKDDDSSVQGCVRLLPTTGPTMSSRDVPGTSGRPGSACMPDDMGKQPLRRRSLHERGEDSGEHRASDLRTVRRHDRVRLNAPAHRHSHRDGRAHGADSVSSALAFAASQFAARDRKDNRHRGLPRSVSRAASVRPGSRASRRHRDNSAEARSERSTRSETMERAIA
jgi:hypothetical protein